MGGLWICRRPWSSLIDLGSRSSAANPGGEVVCAAGDAGSVPGTGCARGNALAWACQGVLPGVRRFPVAVDGHQVDAVEGAAVAEPGDLLACGLDAGHLVVGDLVGEPAGISMSGMVAARRRAMAALARTMTPA